MQLIEVMKMMMRMMMRMVMGMTMIMLTMCVCVCVKEFSVCVAYLAFFFHIFCKQSIGLSGTSTPGNSRLWTMFLK